MSISTHSRNRLLGLLVLGELASLVYLGAIAQAQ